jgi:DNA primase
MSQPEARAGLRARLNDLADRCEDKIVAQEYRRSFNDLFFEEFGFKRPERRMIISAALHTAPDRARLSLRDNFSRSALYGLSNDPQLLRTLAESVANLYIENVRLQRWRDILVKAAYGGAPLDHGAIRSILDADGLADTLNFKLCQDLRFPFLRLEDDESLKRDALEGLVVVLNEEWELDEALVALDRAAKADAGGDKYLAIEAERQYLRDQMTALRTRAYRLGSGGQD